MFQLGRKRLAVVFVALAAACSGAESSDFADETIEQELTQAGVTSALRIDSSWNAGYCATVTLTNGSSSQVTGWTVVLNTAGTTVNNLWNGKYTQSGNTLTVKPESYNAAIPKGATSSFGFCANGTGTPSITSMSIVGGGSSGGTGGAGTGGASTGGTATGGTATGGTATGGTATGGTATGGTATGGSGGTPPAIGLIGWASVSECGSKGTTGGGNGSPTVTVTNLSQLQSALKASGPTVISVSGKISTGGSQLSLSDVKDKTLIGTNNAEISGGISLKASRNVIFKNITFSNGSGGSGDSFELTGSSCAWFDHCTFRDGSDGNLDIVRQSDLVTVSWSRFYYTKGHDHMLSNLNGNGDDVTADRGKIRITYHHNWWGAGVKERMPRVRFGKVHLFNNYYKYEKVSGDAGQNYCIAAGIEANLLVENNYFDGSKNPIIYQSNGEGTAKVTERGNAYVGTSGTKVSTGGAFTPPYPYTMEAGPSVKSSVMSGAGPR